MVLLMGSLDDSNVLVVETTLVFFREMMDMPAVQQSIHSNLARIIRLVLVFLSPHSQVDHSSAKVRYHARLLCQETLETGAIIKVPLFINEGEKIQVDTRTGEYLGRVKE